MFAPNLPPHVSKRVNAIEAKWIKDKRLDAPDWSELTGLSRTYGTTPKKRRRRT